MPSPGERTRTSATVPLPTITGISPVCSSSASSTFHPKRWGRPPRTVTSSTRVDHRFAGSTEDRHPTDRHCITVRPTASPPSSPPIETSHHRGPQAPWQSPPIVVCLPESSSVPRVVDPLPERPVTARPMDRFSTNRSSPSPGGRLASDEGISPDSVRQDVRQVPVTT